MKKKYILYSLAIIIVIYLGFKVGYIVSNSHNTESKAKTYLWLFKDSAKNNIDTMFCVGHVRKNDMFYHYMYKEKYDVLIFEYNKLCFINLNNIPFLNNVNLNNFLDSFSGEAYNMTLYPSPETSIMYELPFNNVFQVNLDASSTIEKRIEGKNYRGFFGKVLRMSFSNSEGKHLVLFDYKREATPTLFLLYKYHGRFLVIMINSEEKFDESIINILKLE